ncbi:hypothetical protein ASG89_31255 [Paenibacillus sp. Soil766]|nr:hypothetical protein ASG89_31255 [Paenibacillus sp. Soil766]
MVSYHYFSPWKFFSYFVLVSSKLFLSIEGEDLLACSLCNKGMDPSSDGMLRQRRLTKIMEELRKIERGTAWFNDLPGSEELWE